MIVVVLVFMVCHVPANMTLYSLKHVQQQQQERMFKEVFTCQPRWFR